jgi:hypothetical protein
MSDAKPNTGGRPKVAPEELRKHRFTVPLSDSERELVEKAADGVPVAIWVRNAALKEARKEQGR